MTKKPLIYIFGHKNPDTDSICSAIAYAELKKIQGHNAKPIRLGKINRETQFVLDYFGIPAPDYLPTVRTQISDLDIDHVDYLQPQLSLKTAWERIKESDIKMAPVVDREDRMVGLVTLSDITTRFMDILSNTGALKITPLKNILNTLEANLLAGSEEQFKPSGKAIIAAMTPDGMAPFVEKDDIVLTGNRKDSQLKSIAEGANCIIVTCNGRVDEDVIQAAEANNCVMIRTWHDTYTAALLLNQSIPVEYVMTKENFAYFHINDYIDEIQEEMLQSRHRAYPVLDNSNRIKGFITRYHLIARNDKRVILVDHNEASQSIDGLEQAQILEIIDHHRIGGLVTGSPIYFKNEAVGSTATIVAGLFLDMKKDLAPDIAGILCAAIISDTMYFKSPTSTGKDEYMAARMAGIAQLDLDVFSKKMLESSSAIINMSPEEILNYDFKEFFINRHKVGIGQITATETKGLGSIKESLIDYLKETLENKEYHVLMMLISDPTKGGSDVLFVEREKGTVNKAFSTSATDNSMFLEGVVSRKKQIIPYLSRAM
ncbi:MAG TPA: putative manganese-dependent inorganic diphosphatase [Clostridiaceae bacterium]|nr:putative manganese-dependent inorganic diphosphatase [Clostridiaceae bacterium]